MQTIITKSLFKEFCENPKLARWHKNDPKVYNKINQELYGDMNGVLIGQEVENMVKKLRRTHDISIVSGYSSKLNYHKDFSDASIQTISLNPPIIYQAGFLFQNLFVKCDFLQHNPGGQYDLIEVKAKNNIRKDNKNQTLLEDLVADCSFQSYILHKVLGKKFSGRVWIYHLNKEYVRDGDIIPEQIINKAEITDDLVDFTRIEQQILAIRQSIDLPRTDFEKRFPYQGENPLIYFGESPQKGTIRNIPHFKTSKKKLLSLYQQGKTQISDLGVKELELISSKDVLENSFQKYVKMFQQGVQFDRKKIKSTLCNLQFPLYFYDYETISWPIPLFQKTSPRQQVVVQYSIHKMDTNEETSHFEGIISPGSPDNQLVVDKFIQNIGKPQGTFIVWNKGFENSRNDEIGRMYPQYKDFFEKINLQTFDLMDVFKDLDYFDPNFGGSCSIKKVLPVLTNISYDDMTVSNGGLASDYLHQLLLNQLPIQVSVQDLLDYCKQDTRAMVEIYNFLKKKVE